MPSPRRRITYTGTGPRRDIPLKVLREDFTPPDRACEPTNAEIVADLHKEIAARSRKGAALVAAYYAMQAEKAAGIEAAREAGRRAWRIRHEGEAAS